MLKLLRPKQHSVLGIDITSSAVKILEISDVGGQRMLKTYGRETLPPDALEGTVIKDINVVANCIKSLVERSKTECKVAAVAVPDSSVITKIIQMNEGLSEQELEELIVIEADKYIPYPIDEIFLDFQVLGQSTKNAALIDVLVVASRAEVVNSRIEAVSRAGLEVKVVDVESYAVERCVQLMAHELPAGGKDKIIAIVDIGAHYTHLFVLSSMRLIFSREESYGGAQLIDAIGEHYKMNSEQAIIAKEQGALPEGYKEEVLEPFKQSILLQIRRTLQFFYSSSQHGYVDHIILAGGSAKEVGLVGLIQDQLGVTTTIANPFTAMTFGKMVNIETINADAPALMVACGLALREWK